MTFPPSPPGFALHFIFVPGASFTVVLALSAALYCYSNSFRVIIKIVHYDTYGGCVTSVVEIYERRQNSKPCICSTTFRRTTLGATGVPNTLFLAFLFSDPDVGVQFLKDVGLIRSSMVCCKYGSQRPGASTLIVRTVTKTMSEGHDLCCIVTANYPWHR